jgi:hypothetical protein
MILFFLFLCDLCGFARDGFARQVFFGGEV